MGIALASASCTLLVDTGGLSGGTIAGPETADPARDSSVAEAATLPVPSAGDAAPPGVDAGHAADAGGSDAAAPDVVADAGGGADVGIDAGTDVGSPTVISLVSSVTKTYVNASNVSASITVTSGDLLVLGAYWSSGAGTATVSVTDSQGNAWQSAAVQGNPSCGTQAQIWFVENAKGGSDTVTVSRLSGNISCAGLFLLDYSGIAAAGALDSQIGAVPSNPSNQMDPGALSPTGSADLVVALFADISELGSMIAGPGFHALATDNGFNAMIEDDLPDGAPPGSVDPTAFLAHNDTSSCWVATAAAFKGR